MVLDSKVQTDELDGGVDSGNPESTPFLMNMNFDHIVLNVKDIHKALEFYIDILGLSPDRVEEFHSGTAPFPSVRINPHSIIDLFPPEMQETRQDGSGRQSLNHFCLSLDKQEWQGLKNRLEENQIPILEGPVSRWGAQGQGVSIYFRDFDGIQIEARYYETSLEN